MAPQFVDESVDFSPEKTECLKNELQHLLELDIIAPDNSPYGLHVQMVPKENGKFRITGYYQMLNQKTQKDSYWIPFLHDFVDRLSGSKLFSKVDLFKSYHQIPVLVVTSTKQPYLLYVGHMFTKDWQWGSLERLKPSKDL